jgi:hypothetical protein
MRKKSARIVKRNSWRKKISIGPAEFTNRNGVVKCGGAVENEGENNLDVSLTSTKPKQIMRKTKSTRTK